MRVELIDTTDGFERLLQPWSELLQASDSNGPFLSPEWLHAWWTHLGESGHPQLFTVHDGDLLAGIAPFQLVRGPLGVLPRLEFLGLGFAGSDYLDVIVRRGCEAETARALADTLEASGRVLLLRHVRPTSMIVRLADHLTRSGWTAWCLEDGLCPVIVLQGQSWDSYLASLGRSHRANFRRRLRALTAKFTVVFERVQSDSDRRAALASLIRFHDERFGARDCAFLTPALRAFHDEATRRMLEGGCLRMYVLRLDGVPVGIMYGFMQAERFYFYQHGFDRSYEPFSVGLVLMGLTIRAAIDEGAIEFDMLYGTEPYKWLWAREQRALTRVQLFPPNVTGLLHRRTIEGERSMRMAARRVLTLGGARAG
jgi:CelD/BcsL family acetyltransferase involved in cellulose biosynthesis